MEHNTEFEERVKKKIAEKKNQKTNLSFGSLNLKNFQQVLEQAVRQAVLIHATVCDCGKQECNLVNNIGTWLIQFDKKDDNPFDPVNIKNLTYKWKEYIDQS